MNGLKSKHASLKAKKKKTKKTNNKHENKHGMPIFQFDISMQIYKNYKLTPQKNLTIKCELI